MNQTVTITLDEVSRIEHELFEAMKTSNVQVLDGLLHDDLLFLLPNGQTVNKQADLDSHRAKAMVIEEAELIPGEISIIDDCAISTVTLNASGRMLGQPLSGEFRYVRVWKKFGNGLKVIGGSCIQTS